MSPIFKKLKKLGGIEMMKEVTYLESLNPVTFSLDNGNLIVDKILISEKSFLEISLYDNKSKIYK